jgi:hypothetical protein
VYSVEKLSDKEKTRGYQDKAAVVELEDSPSTTIIIVNLKIIYKE